MRGRRVGGREELTCEEILGGAKSRRARETVLAPDQSEIDKVMRFGCV